MAKDQNWQVHKFGGTSVIDSKCIKNAYQIIKSYETQGLRIAVVVSAMKGVTDDLIQTVKLAVQKNKDDAKALLNTIKIRHDKTIQELLPSHLVESVQTKIHQDFQQISTLLDSIGICGSASDLIYEFVSGHGEVWSAQIIGNYFDHAGLSTGWWDAREILVVQDPHKTIVDIDWNISKSQLQQSLKTLQKDHVVITGFVASTAEKVPTTLKRNGSDYSASIFGALLDAKEITIWSDVDGVLSADPRLVPEAMTLEDLSYDEVTELAYFGARIVHPATMAPVIKKNIPIWIKNTFRPDVRGTLIQKSSSGGRPVKGFSAIDEVALINVEWSGLIGVPGSSERLFAALRSVQVSVIVISQSSSEMSICFAVNKEDAIKAKNAVEKAFYSEIHQGLVQQLEVSLDCSILAVVGDHMAYHPGIAGRFFKSLGAAGINIRAIAQGSSERNISAVIDQKDTIRALRAAHAAFYLSHQTISLGIVGTGLIGKEFLAQLSEQLQFLRKERNIDLQIRGVCNSKKMLLTNKEVNLQTWESDLAAAPATDLNVFANHLLNSQLPHTLIVDMTASSEIPKHYSQWLEKGINIITPNKKANTESMAMYSDIRKVAKQKNKYFLYSTNVGAGLPVIQTLKDLIHTGDQFLQIEGIFSGTLSYIFNTFSADKKFSDVVKQAKDLGYTEPDPRDDLSGTDVARKLVILAREVGWKIELKDVKIESLVPESLRQGSSEEYLKKLLEFDHDMSNLFLSAQKNNQVLRYVGSINEAGEATVKLQKYPQSHAFARIHGSDNIVAFRTKRYDKQPLIIQGPGAGPAVTAAGVFADILRFATYIGALP